MAAASDVLLRSDDKVRASFSAEEGSGFISSAVVGCRLVCAVLCTDRRERGRPKADEEAMEHVIKRKVFMVSIYSIATGVLSIIMVTVQSTAVFQTRFITVVFVAFVLCYSLLLRFSTVWTPVRVNNVEETKTAVTSLPAFCRLVILGGKY